MRVYYNEGYHVDVPAIPEDRDRGPIPRFEKTGMGARGARLETLGREIGDEVVQDGQRQPMFGASTDGNSGQFVRMTRLMKKFREKPVNVEAEDDIRVAISRLVEECYLEIVGRNDEASGC